MSLRQHCDVEGCESSAEISTLSPDMLPDGWFVVVGSRKCTAPPQAHDFAMEVDGRLIQANMQLPSLNQTTERVSFVVCDAHALPWKVRARREMGA